MLTFSESCFRSEMSDQIELWKLWFGHLNLNARNIGLKNLRLYCANMPVTLLVRIEASHDGVIKWKHFPRNWPFVRRIHRSPVNSLHKGQWRRTLMFSLICVWINDWINNGEAGDLRRYGIHYDVTVMAKWIEAILTFLFIWVLCHSTTIEISFCNIVFLYRLR